MIFKTSRFEPPTLITATRPDITKHRCTTKFESLSGRPNLLIVSRSRLLTTAETRRHNRMNLEGNCAGLRNSRHCLNIELTSTGPHIVSQNGLLYNIVFSFRINDCFNIYMYLKNAKSTKEGQPNILMSHLMTYSFSISPLNRPPYLW